MGLVSLLFSFNGRINRAQYWGGTLGVGGAGIALTVMASVMTATSAMNAHDAGKTAAALGLSMLMLPLNALSAWCGLALQVKRFHDRGRTGWLTLIPMVLALWLVFSVIGAALHNAPLAQMFDSIQAPFLLLMLVSLAFFVDLGCLPGESGPNKFGNPPGSPRAPSAKPLGSQPSTTDAPASAANSLLAAQAAIDRAIADGPRLVPVRQTALATATPPSPAPLGGGGAPAFGRRVTR